MNGHATESSLVPNWRSVVEHLDGTVIVADLTGRAIWVNRAIEPYVSRPHWQIAGSLVWEFPEVRGMAREVKERFASAARGESTQPLVLSLTKPDGTTAVTEWSATALSDDGGRPTHVVITGHDRTKQYAAEVALREHDERFRDAFERHDAIWWEIDLVTGAGTWPDAAEAFYGVAGSGLPHSLELWRSRLHPDDREADERLTRRMLEEGWTSFEVENRIVHPEKGLRWIRTHGRVLYSPSGEPIRLAGIDTDITERRAADLQLKESRDEFQILTDSLPQIVWTAGADGRPDYYNRQWTAFTGLSEADGKGGGWQRVLHHEDVLTTTTAWALSLESGAPFEVEHRLRRHDGTYRWFISRALAVRDGDGRITKWFGTGTDVHDQKEAALDLARRTEQQATAAEIGVLAVRSTDVTTVVQTALARVLAVLGCDLGSIQRLRRTPTGAEFRLEAAVGLPVELLGTTSLSAATDSQAGFTLAHGEPVCVEDMANETRFSYPFAIDAVPIVSGLSVVIHGSSEPYGVLAAHSTSRRSFDAADVAFVQSVANVLAEAIQRRETDTALESRVRRLDALRTIDDAITDGTDLHSTLSVIVEQVREQLTVDAVAAFVYHGPLQTLEFVAGAGFRSDVVREDVPHLGEGYLGSVALERRIRHVSDLTMSRDWVRTELLHAEGFITYFGVPLVVKGALEGVLEIFHRARLEPDAGWQEFLAALGTQTAIAINSSRLFTELAVSNDKLRLAYDATIEGWARALELKDNQTEGHSRRVTNLTVRLASRLGVSSSDLIGMRRGALLHDIGKMGIPDHILLKEGELDPEEWQEMRTHPRRAYDLLRPIGFLANALDIPHAHHERWDGSGYPRGLAGDEIPLAARIFAVVDVYDALTSKRPYWPAWSKERALGYVREQAGKHFDPAVAEAFVAMMAEPVGVR